MSKALTIVVQGYTGLDVLLYFLPLKLQARLVARRCLRGPYKGWDVANVPLVLVVGGAAWRVTSSTWLPAVEPTTPDTGPRA